MVKANLEAQQNLRFEKLTTAILHLFEETPGHLRLGWITGALEHDLEDLLKVNRGFHLRLLDKKGEIRFSSQPGVSPSGARSYSFALPAEAQKTNHAIAELTLDTGPDKVILDRLAAILWGTALIGSAAITLGGYLIVYFGLAPIRRLAEQTHNLAILSLDKRLAEVAPRSWTEIWFS